MITNIINWISAILADFSYAGVFFLMTIDSLNIPIPSEVVLAFTGFLVGRGEMNMHLAALTAGLAGVFGSLLSYTIAYFGGRPLIERYGKYLLIHKTDLAGAERWLEKHGELIFFFGRFIPVIRTFISLPAGILRARLVPFTLYTFGGTVVWSYIFIALGSSFGERWEVIEPVMKQFQWAVVGMLGMGIVWYVHRHVKKRGKLIPD